MKLTKEEFVTRVLDDLNRRKKQKEIAENDIEFYYRRKFNKYYRARLNRKKR